MTPNWTSDLRLSGILEERLRVEGNNYVALAAAVTAANKKGRDASDVIDRRKLKKIVERDPGLVLSMSELHFLDRYLEPLGLGLAYISIFDRPNVLESIADADYPVTFVLGSKPSDDYGLHLSHWDVMALAEIQRGVNRFSPGVLFDIRDVLLHGDVKNARRSVHHGRWVKLLDEDGPSLVCLGSGRANHAAEAILCKMCGVETFDAKASAKVGLPFHFVWPEERDHNFPSAFNRSPSDAGLTRSEERSVKGGASALATAKGNFVDTLNRSHRGVCFGVCAAQRRSNGQIWVVFAGVSGAATHATALLAGRLAFNLRSKPTGENSPVLWAVVAASLSRDQRRAAGNFLIVTDPQVVSGPYEWPPA